MRTLLLAFLTIVALAAADAGPHLPSLTQATVQPASLPGYLVIADPRATRGYDALLIPLARIVWITDRVMPKGTREERTLTLGVDLGGESLTTFVFDDGTGAKPAEVMAALIAAR